jgi:hypothetical protein
MERENINRDSIIDKEYRFQVDQPMTTTKKEVIAIIKKMPDDASLDDIMAELYFRFKVDTGVKELDDGKGIPHDEVKGRVEKWLK